MFDVPTAKGKIMPTLDEIMAVRTPQGGWTRKQLAEWGVSWPPKQGWIRRLADKAEPPEGIEMKNDDAMKATIRHFEGMITNLEQAGFRVEKVDNKRYEKVLEERAEALRKTGLLKRFK
jgi:hypothetical protein